MASVTAASAGQVLVLRRHFVDELMKSDPACAAEVLFGLARVLADRQYLLRWLPALQACRGRCPGMPAADRHCRPHGATGERLATPARAGRVPKRRPALRLARRGGPTRADRAAGGRARRRRGGDLYAGRRRRGPVPRGQRQVRVSVSAHGTERMLDDLGRGAIVGEMALLSDRPRAATVHAVRDSDLLFCGSRRSSP